MTRIVDSSEAEAQLAHLVEEVQGGKRVVISSAGRPVAILSAHREDPTPRVFGAWRGRVWLAGDFDDPLPVELNPS